MFLIGFLIVLSLFFKDSQKEDLSFFSAQNLLKGQFLSTSLGPPTFSSKIVSEASLVQESQLLFSAPPYIVKPQVLGTFGFSEELSEKGGESGEIFEYTVEEGDSLSGIASYFGISLQTLLWANDLNKNSLIKLGQKLIILPVSGVIHMVKKGDTVSQIAKTYGGNVEEIIVFNELLEEGDIFIGDILIIPGGKMPQKSSPQKYVSSDSEQVPLASSYFICPIPSPCKITQGLHWYNAIDFSHADISCGLPVFAVAGGEVLRTKYGYNRGAGNYIHILHPNGVVTVYYHLQSILVGPGQKVSQGQIIGLIGHTGYTIPSGSRGCHLHFEVRGARNPFSY